MGGSGSLWAVLGRYPEPTYRKNNNNHNRHHCHHKNHLGFCCPVVYNWEDILASSKARDLSLGSYWGIVITFGALGTLFSAVVKFNMVQLEKCENKDTLLEGAPDYHNK